MSARKLRITAAARGDLEEIRRYTVETWGRDQWLAYYGGLEGVFVRISREPWSGRDRSALASGLRSMPYRSHLVFFHENRRGELVVLRVLHQRQNAEALRWDDMLGA